MIEDSTGSCGIELLIVGTGKFRGVDGLDVKRQSRPPEGQVLVSGDQTTKQRQQCAEAEWRPN